jgi:hypothetical protein
MRARALLGHLAAITLAAGGLAEIAKFATFLGHYVLFPTWPDVVDLAVLAANVGAFFGLYIGVLRSKKKS